MFDAQAGEADIIAEQACFLPIADRGRPLIGKVKGIEGAFVCSGYVLRSELELIAFNDERES